MAKYVNLAKFLKNKDIAVRKASAEALNRAGAELVSKIKANMDAQGIREDTGALRGSIDIVRATPDNVNLTIKSEVFKPLPRRRGLYNRSIKYPSRGVPYGRILEFSPRIRKPFFYTAWYNMRRRIKTDIIEAIGNAWSGKL